MSYYELKKKLDDIEHSCPILNRIIDLERAIQDQAEDARGINEDLREIATDAIDKLGEAEDERDELEEVIEKLRYEIDDLKDELNKLKMDGVEKVYHMEVKSGILD